jgi:alkaline phosphatase D
MRANIYRWQDFMNAARLIFRVQLAILSVCAINLEAQENRALQEIVFGSCLDLTEHPMLDKTLKLPMDLFLFLGDNVYADTTDAQVMREKYIELKTSRFFQTLRQQVPIMATWDDHDFGLNDAGASYTMRGESQQLFLDWLDEPANSPRRHQAGIYNAASFGPDAQRIQVIMLDTRYFRSPLAKGEHNFVPSGGPYIPNDDPQATMLGEEQWQWMEDRLREPARLRLIGSSIQFIPSAHGGESWSNLPKERQRMLELIRETQAGGIVFLSGDRHWCEFSRMEGPLGYPLYDFTASSMTQVHSRGTPTPNAYRFIEKTFHQPNVGRLSIDWNLADPSLTFQILDQNGKAQLAKQIYLSEIHPE